jgi:membrane protein insertase Oxa1/YidC/SpoIIIJ
VALPLMVGYFALCVPSGLSLYYFSNTVVTGMLQVRLAAAWPKAVCGARPGPRRREEGNG